MEDKNNRQNKYYPVNQPVKVPEIPRVNYWMISTLILTFLLFGILGWFIFSLESKTHQPEGTDTSNTVHQEQKTGVFIQLEKTTFRSNESIIFTITNKTLENVYYFPETCASSLVQIFFITDYAAILIKGDPKVCLLAPAVKTLLPNESITSKIPDRTLSEMAPGKYKINFEYSTVKRDQNAIGEHSTSESITFILAK